MVRKSSLAETKPGFEKSKYFVPVVFGMMFLGLVILFGEFLFSGKMLYGSDMMASGVHHRSFLVEYFNEHGEIPQWDPNTLGGVPFVDAFHGDIFYPFSVLKFFMPLHFYLGFNLFLHIFFAGIFMYLAARQFRLGKIASLFSAAGYMFAPFLISLVALGHDGNIYVTALFPLVILFLSRAFEKAPFFNFTMTGLIIGIIILSPHPQMSYFTLWATGLFTLFQLIVLYRKKKSIITLIKPASLAAYAVVIALLLSAIQFYPGYVYTTKFSPRFDTKSGWEWATSWSLHEEEAFSLLIPEFAGANDRKGETHYWGKNGFKGNSESTGVVLILMSWIGLFFSRRREAWFFGGLSLFAFLYALGGTTPFFSIFYYIIPKVQTMRSASMIMFIFLFSISMLSGMGVQSIIDRRNDKPIRRKIINYYLFGFPFLLFILALLFSAAGPKMISLWTSLFYSEAATTFVRDVTKLELATRNLSAIQSGAWFSFLFSALAAFLAWFHLSIRSRTILISVIVLIPMIDGMRFNSKFITVSDPERFLEPTPISNYLSEQPGKFRTLELTGGTLPKSHLQQNGLDNVKGYHGNHLRWYYDLLGGQSMRNELNPRFLNLIGTRYILLWSELSFPDDYLGKIPLSEAFTYNDVKIIENRNAFERVYLVNKFKLIPDRHDIYPEVLNGLQDLRNVVYLEKIPEITIPEVSMDSDSAWIEYYDTDSIKIGVRCTVNRILTLSDNYYDSWHVFVDGKQVELLRTYGCFRGVAVPAGVSEVSFKYESKRYATGKLITWLTSLYLIIVIGCTFWRGRREQEEQAGTLRVSANESTSD